MHQGSCGSEYVTTYTYDSDNRPTAVKFGTETEKVVYTYDELGRMATRKQYNGSSSTVRNSATYSYLAGSQSASGYTSCTPLVSGINQTGIDFSYGYDSETANITSEARTGGSYGGTTTYAYDSMGQLVRVNDPVENATWVYTYDLGGNILNKKKYAYTTGTVGSVQQTIAYTYDSAWKDELATYNGTTLSHDAIGNLLSDGTWTYTWAAGRQLSGMSKSGTEVEFAYDHNGLRVKKKVGTTETHYTLNGKLVVHLTKGTDWMHFYYDAQGRPAMVNFNGTKYHYLHNLQGDIIGIVDASGTIVVEYKYDAWGKIIARTGSLVSTLGYLNPFRYRGYVYDEETGLYYLRSRYYNPEWGRFINADVEIGETGEMLVHNIFAYCENNPITNVDPTGESSWKALAWTGIMIAAIGLLVLATISTGGGALAFAGAGVAAAATTAANAAVGVGLATTLGSTIMFAKQTKKSQKERATDHPSWVNNGDIKWEDTAHENAARMMDEKYGKGNWDMSTSEKAYSKILKWLRRDVGLK